MGHLLKMSMKKDSLVSCPKIFLFILQKGIDIHVLVCYCEYANSGHHTQKGGLMKSDRKGGGVYGKANASTYYSASATYLPGIPGKIKAAKLSHNLTAS